MPVLDLCRLSVSDAWLYTLAVIHWPQDLDEQAKSFARLQNELVRHELNKPKPDQVPIAERRILQAAAAKPIDSLIDRDNNRTSGARICAMMFMQVLAYGGSLRSVVKKLGETFPRGARESICWKHWNDFRPAAHLEAARLFWHFAPSDLGSFFAIAEELRRRGEAHVLLHPGRTLLDPAETWRVPEGISLPPLPDTFEMPPRGF